MGKADAMAMKHLNVVLTASILAYPGQKLFGGTIEKMDAGVTRLDIVGDEHLHIPRIPLISK